MTNIIYILLMTLRHATTRTALRQIQKQGLLIAKADRSAKIKGCWLHSPAASPWAVLHTIRKHGAALSDVVVVEVTVPRSQLTRFRRGLWFSRTDVPPSALGRVWSGAEFGASASE